MNLSHFALKAFVVVAAITVAHEAMTYFAHAMAAVSAGFPH
jgi:hypothetical protein